jgi:uncharacterized cupin superfamily protein
VRYVGPVPNLFEPEWDAEVDRGPFRWRRARLGGQSGAEKLGASVYEIPPGAASFPLHAHYANEEMILVLDGRPTLRDHEGERELRAGEVVACPTGRRGVHRLDNRTGEPVRVLIVSTMVSPEIVEYPDSGKVAARGAAPGSRGGGPEGVEVIARPEDSLDYFEGEL